MTRPPIAPTTFALLVMCVSMLSTEFAHAQQADIEGCSAPSQAFGGDPSFITDDIEIVDSMAIADVQILVDITHTFIGDLFVSVAHDGTEVVLHDGNGGADQDLDIIFSDDGARSGGEESDCECAVRPIGPGQLSDFDGQDVLGQWSLSIEDYYPGSDDGVLSHWCVRAYKSPPPPPPPGLHNLICQSPRGSGVVQAIWNNLVAYDTIEVSLDGQQVAVLPGSATTWVSPPLSIPSVVDVCFQGIVDGVAAPRRCCTVPIEQEIDIEECISPGVTVSEFLQVLSPITVADALTVGDVQVDVAITHTFIGDLLIDLSSPNGTTVRLHDGDGAGDDNILVTYWEFGAENGDVPYDCDCAVRPSGPGSLIDYVGEQSAGLWRLSIIDQFAGDFGTLNRWCLRIFEDIPVFGVSGLDCQLAATPGSVQVTWINSTDYDEVAIYVDGQLEGSLTEGLIAGETMSYETLPVPSPQQVQICVIPILGGTAGAQQCCSIYALPLPVADLTIDSEAGSGFATLSWTNPTSYDRIRVYIDGTLSDELPGDATEFATPTQSPQATQACVEGVIDSFGNSPFACRNVWILDAALADACSSPNAPIADYDTPTIDELTIDDDLLILDLEVSVNITHTFIGDLDVDLTSPGGTSVRLHDQGGGSTDDIFVRYTDSGLRSGAVPFDCGCAIQPAGFAGTGATSDFNYESSQGTWTLSITDNLELDDGQLNRWCVRVLDSCDIPVVSDIVCTVLDGDVSLTWNNEAAYDSIEISQDGALLATLPGSATSFVDDRVGPGVHGYQVTVHRDGIDCGAPSPICTIAFGITDIIFQGEGIGLVDSTAALRASLEAQNRVPLVTRDFDAGHVHPAESNVETIWVQLGTYPANHGLTPDEGLLLAELHTGDVGLDGEIEGSPIPVYIEGGDIWGFDAPTAFADYDGVASEGVDDGDDSLYLLSGQDTGLGIDLSAPEWQAYYQQDQVGVDYNDQLVAAVLEPDLGGSAVASLWHGGESSGEYEVGLYYASSIAPVISVSFEFGGVLADLPQLADAYGQVLRGESLPPEDTLFRRGDWDGDGSILINDPIAALSYIFGDVYAVDPNCHDAADANDDGTLGIADPIFLLSYIFGAPEGQPPFAPGPFICGPDPTPDGLIYCVYPLCAP